MRNEGCHAREKCEMLTLPLERDQCALLGRAPHHLNIRQLIQDPLFAAFATILNLLQKRYLALNFGLRPQCQKNEARLQEDVPNSGAAYPAMP